MKRIKFKELCPEYLSKLDLICCWIAQSIKETNKRHLFFLEMLTIYLYGLNKF